MIGLTMKGIFRFGTEFVDFPKLLPLATKKVDGKLFTF